jgi:hypothetical protein
VEAMELQNNNYRGTAIYQETIPLCRTYHLVMFGIIIVLLALIVIFIATAIYPGIIATVPTLIFIIWLYAKFQKIVLSVTVDEFIIRFWLKTLRISISDIASVEVKDPSILPEPYRGHVKVSWGYSGWKDLKIIIFHRGDGIHIRKKNGELIIVTPKDPEKLCETLKRQIDQN